MILDKADDNKLEVLPENIHIVKCEIRKVSSEGFKFGFGFACGIICAAVILNAAMKIVDFIFK